MRSCTSHAKRAPPHQAVRCLLRGNSWCKRRCIVEDTFVELNKDCNAEVLPEDEKKDDFPLHDGDIEPNPEDRKSAKRPLSPLKKIVQNVEEKKVKVESEFHESFLNTVDATLAKVKFTLPKDDILKLLIETKNVRNQNSKISNLGLDSADLKIEWKILLEHKISLNMKSENKDSEQTHNSYP
ncbi:hypothetical protein M8J75_007159 [Diaphorina citri]|nr:hypothetical protein M8J75_007159 [Diaphorina citri]KAI5751905.1 hypothetical protein M8J77_011984 [Diaphorina citri]